MLRVRSTQILLCLVAILLGGAEFARAAQDPPSLQELRKSWSQAAQQTGLSPSLRRSGVTRTDALDTLAGGLPEGVRCASPLLVALHQDSADLSPASRALMDRATIIRSIVPGATTISPDGRFRVHYWSRPSPDAVDAADLDIDGVPDGVERIASELTDVLADFVHLLEWPAAEAGDGDMVDVFLVNLSGSIAALDGFALPKGVVLDPDARPEGVGSVIFLDTGLADRETTSRPAITHQVAHMILNRESVLESPWWHESSAAWLEDRLEATGPEQAARFGLDTFVDRPRGLSDDDLGYGLESFLWPHYLMDSTGSDVDLLRGIWQEMAAVPGNNTFEAIDRHLGRSLESSLAEEVRVFHIWNLFLGQADDGGHYRLGNALPTPQGDATFEAFPARGTSLSGPIFPLGSTMLRILGDGSRGGLRITVIGDDIADWDVSLVIYSAERPSDIRFLPLEFDDSGQAYVSFPWKSMAAVDILVQNLSSPDRPAADYAFVVDHDPAVPFDLMNFTVSQTRQGAVLTWTTESEDRVAGWNIHRGPGPIGPFTRINTLLVPGAGIPGQEMQYVFIDETARPGHKYYYRIQGVTFEGFTETTHPAGVRLAPRD